MDTSGQNGQAVRLCDRNNTQHRQADCTHAKADERRNGRRAGLFTQKRRKNQIARAKKHGKQRQTDQQARLYI